MINSTSALLRWAAEFNQHADLMHKAAKEIDELTAALRQIAYQNYMHHMDGCANYEALQLVALAALGDKKNER